MPYIVQPIEGLRQLPNPPGQPGVYLRQLVEWRIREIEDVWQRLAADLNLNATERLRADKAVAKLPAVGVLIVPDWIARLERLRTIRWIKVTVDRKIPECWVADPVDDPGPPQPWHLGRINKPAGSTGGGVTVGVIDTGYDPTYPDLGSFAPTFAKYVDPPANVDVPGSMQIKPAADSSTSRHGSKVCVMLAGNTCGVAPKAKVLFAAMKDIGWDTTRAMTLIALDWLLRFDHGAAAAHPDRPLGCDIITTSLAVSPAADDDMGSEIADALDKAELFHTLIVAAIGNTNKASGDGEFCAPGTMSKVIGVGAISKGLIVSPFSAFGTTSAGDKKPDLVAPGEGLEFPDGNGGKISDGGTSFAAPIVAGAAALILEKFPALRGSAGDFRTKLLTKVDLNIHEKSPTTGMQQPNTGSGGKGMINLLGL